MSGSNIYPITQASSVLTYALKYARLGWHVFPVWNAVDGKCSCGKTCTSPGKHPIGPLVVFGQSQATTDEVQIRKWWTAYPNASIGVNLKMSKLCAVDIDPRNGGHYTIEQIESEHGPLVSDVLSFSGGGGEHRVFQLPDDNNYPGTLGKGIDFQANKYIVLPPSSHISGGTYEWEASSDPTEGAIPSPLPDWIRDIARSAVVFDGSNSVPPALALTDAEIDEIRAALMFIDSDDRETWLQVGMAIQNDLGGSAGFDIWSEWSQSSPKFKHHDQVRVWNSFKRRGMRGVTKATIFKLAMDAGWNNKRTFATPAVSIDEIVIQEIVKPKALAPSVFPVPVLNELVEWMETFEERPTRAISIQGVLALTAVLGGRIYKSSNSNDSSLYLMTLAPTGYGKGYPAKAIKSLLSRAQLDNLMQGAGNTSAGAVFGALREKPCHIQVCDEIGKQYQAARKQPNGQLAEGFTALTIAYSETDSTMLPRNYSTEGLTAQQIAQRGPRFIVHPSITLFSFATFEQVFNNLSTSDIDDGFLNRQIIVHADEERLPERDREYSEPSPRLIAWAKSMRRVGVVDPVENLRGINTAYHEQPLPVVVPISPEARLLFKAFKREAESHTDDRLKIAIRWNENAMRMATGMAIAENPKNPVVGTQIAQWCIDYVRLHGERFFELAENHIADNEVHRLRNQVLTAILNAGPKGRKFSELGAYCRMWKASTMVQQQNVVESLTLNDQIVAIEPEKKSGRGRKSVMPIYIHRSFIKDEAD